MNKFDAIRSFLLKICAAYQNFTVNELSQEIWIEGLKGLSAKEIDESLKDHIKESPFPPTVADIRVKAFIVRDFNKRSKQKYKALQPPRDIKTKNDLSIEQVQENKRKLKKLLIDLNQKGEEWN